MKRIVFVIVAALALASTATLPARASCYTHCHDDGYGNTTCHTNCY